MKLSKYVFVVLVMLVSLLGSGMASADTPATRETVLKFMAVMGINEQMKLMWPMLVKQAKQSFPNAPQAFWDKMGKEADTDSLVALMVPIYMNNMSEEDIQAATAFYQTPQGQHMLKALPVAMQQAMQAGRQWGEAQGRKIAQEYCAETPDDPVCKQ